MNRKKFIKNINNSSFDFVNEDAFESTINYSVELGKKYSDYLGQDALTVILEELAELSEANILQDSWGVLEEFIDVFIVEKKLYYDFDKILPKDESALFNIYVLRTQKLITKYMRKKGDIEDKEELRGFVLNLIANLNMIMLLIKKTSTNYTDILQDDTKINKALNVKSENFLEKIKKINSEEK